MNQFPREIERKCIERNRVRFVFEPESNPVDVNDGPANTAYNRQNQFKCFGGHRDRSLTSKVKSRKSNLKRTPALPDIRLWTLDFRLPTDKRAIPELLISKHARREITLRLH